VPFSLRGFGFSDTAIAVVGGRRRGHTPFLFRIPFGWFSTIPKNARKDHSEDDGCERDRENKDEDGAMAGWSVDIKSIPTGWQGRSVKIIHRWGI
jgi:peptidoglycan/xylan/chitin deacetylase (PgdA/CDA1 family)